jgi:hypothetical protein
VQIARAPGVRLEQIDPLARILFTKTTVIQATNFFSGDFSDAGNIFETKIWHQLTCDNIKGK